ncbi:MAG: hypothetical protein HeimC3_19660 [Candidatus Heimdallarchaeota archaeon LC_3]|nr:MAG: hypothetical protein HeimC3_19660 [Candidatus Heimdallarchaeota archaeon LC_3]
MLKKAGLIIVPFLFLIFGIYLFESILILPDWIIDEDSGSRKFLLGIYGFSGLVIMINLIHFQIYTENNRIKISYQLSHRFSADRDIHELKMKNVYICTGCFGSFLGILLGLLLLGPYLLISIPSNQNYWTLLIPTLFILMGYSRYIFELNPKIRIFQHFSLFFGLFFLFVVIDFVYSSFYMLIISFPIILSFIAIRLLLAKINEENN